MSTGHGRGVRGCIGLLASAAVVASCNHSPPPGAQVTDVRQTIAADPDPLIPTSIPVRSDDDDDVFFAQCVVPKPAESLADQCASANICSHASPCGAGS